MSDRETAENLATEIILWQSAAQQLPLPEMRAVLADLQHDLAHSLDAFNDICRHHAAHGESTNTDTDTLTAALSEVAQQATCTAIFALGLTQRTRQVAQQN
jgi:hypothetical protein